MSEATEGIRACPDLEQKVPAAAVDPDQRERRATAVSSPDRLSDADSILMTLDRDPLLRSSITALVIFDQEPPFAEVVERFAALCRRTRRFRSRVVTPRAPWDRPRWEEDPYFDVSTHVRHVRAAHPSDLRAVLDLAQSMAPMAFDPTRPLWEAIVVDGVIGGKAALIMRVHHAVIDGVGGLLVAATMMDRDRAGHPLLAEQDGRSEITTTVQTRRARMRRPVARRSLPTGGRRCLPCRGRPG